MFFKNTLGLILIAGLFGCKNVDFGSRSNLESTPFVDLDVMSSVHLPSSFYFGKSYDFYDEAPVHVVVSLTSLRAFKNDFFQGWEEIDVGSIKDRRRFFLYIDQALPWVRLKDAMSLVSDQSNSVYVVCEDIEVDRAHQSLLYLNKCRSDLPKLHSVEVEIVEGGYEVRAGSNNVWQFDSISFYDLFRAIKIAQVKYSDACCVVLSATGDLSVQEYLRVWSRLTSYPDMCVLISD